MLTVVGRFQRIVFPRKMNLTYQGKQYMYAFFLFCLNMKASYLIWNNPGNELNEFG